MDATVTGQRIRAARKAAGFSTIREFSEAIGAYQGRISVWENGHAMPSTAWIAKIASACDCSVDHLLALDGEAA